MENADALDELMICRLDAAKRQVEPCTLIIFGASGDLTARKLIPALYHLHAEKSLKQPFRIIGMSRSEKSSDQFRSELHEAFDKYSRDGAADADTWKRFAQSIFYCRGDLGKTGDLERLQDCIKEAEAEELKRNLLFYLAVSPSKFGTAVRQLSEVGLIERDPEAGWRRVVVEKPFGHDLASAQKLNAELIHHVHEQDIFRIDHYLGKETVQNILMFRFSNAIFEKLWHRDCVDHIQITVSEDNNVGSRAGYYEEAGALRDMVQNHLLQVMALIGIEPPQTLESEAIRDEKVKFLQSIRPIYPPMVSRQVVRGQYTAGRVNQQKRCAYRDEEKAADDSNVETFVALKLMVDNWRWSGVPFYLRTGKNLPLSASEVRVQFKPTPQVLFAAQCGTDLDMNSLTLRLQPHEGITLRFNGKIPGTSVQIRPVRMHFSYDAEFGAYTPEAYERLLLEAISGNPTLFIRRDELETAWKIVDSIRAGWKDHPLSDKEFYPAGTWGPDAANELLLRDGRSWRNPTPIPVGESR